MDIEPNILDALQQHEADEAFDVNLRFKQLRNFFCRCESPLEQLFLYYLITRAPLRLLECRTGYCIETRQPALLFDKWSHDCEDFRVKMFAQYPIPKASESGEYRADFLLELLHDIIVPDDENPRGKWMSEVYARLVIEVDGHEFHERTKAQARRDKSRDRYFIGQGYTVFRFTGTEVFCRTDYVIDEVGRYLENVMAKAREHKISPLALVRGGVMMDSRRYDQLIKRYSQRPLRMF